jgi:hypothetical protein
MYNFIDLTGKKFGKILVIERCEDKIYSGNRNATQWNCVCDCDKTVIIKVTSNAFRGGKTHCGCSRPIPVSRNVTHGMTNTRLFDIWRSMRARCNNKNHVAYEKYGGRGITVCDEWLGKTGFQNLYDWAINSGYNEDLSLDRIDNDKGYYPENCRWATPSEQQRNRRDNTILSYNGETKTLYEWCEIFDSNSKLVYWRIKHNYPTENLFDPPRTWEAEKKSGYVGVLWQKRSQQWVVKGYKDGKVDKYVTEFKNLEDAIKFKIQYDIDNPPPKP